MNKKLVLILALVLCFTACFAVACEQTPEECTKLCPDCGKCTDEACTTHTDKCVCATIESVITSGKANDDVVVTGVVYAKFDGSFFITDGTKNLYVKSATTAAVGDKVLVSGKIGKSSKQVFIKNATAQVKASAQTVPTAADKTIAQVAAVANESANYYQIVNLSKALVTKTATGYKLSDEAVTISVDSDFSEGLTSWETKRISGQVLLLNCSTDGWEVAPIVASWTELPIDLEGLKADLFAAAAPAANVFGQLSLVTSSKDHPALVYTWSVAEGTAITITDNVATVNAEVETDSAVVLKLVISAGEAKVEQTFNVTVKAASSYTLDTIKTATIGENEKVWVSGIVIAMGADNMGHAYTVIADKTTHTLGAIIEDLKLANVAIGDEIKVLAGYVSVDWKVNTDKVISGVVSHKVISTGNKVDYSALNPTTLQTEADYVAAYNNGDMKALAVYKVVSPYLIYSGNTTYNFIRFGATAETAENGVTKAADIKGNITCIYRENFTDDNGFNALEEKLGVPRRDAGAKKYEVLTFYAVAVYVNGTNNESWQFIIPSVDCVDYDLAGAADAEIKAAVTTEINAAEAGTIVLPESTTNSGTITWTSSNNEVLNATTGAYAAVTAETKVTLTASYTVDGSARTTEIVVTLKPAAKVVYTVSQVMALDVSEKPVVNITGVVVGVVPSHSGSGSATGLYISDGTKVVTLTKIDGNITQVVTFDADANAKGKFTYKFGETAVSVGDIITLDAVTANGKTIAATESTVAAIVGKQNIEGEWCKFAVDTVIDSEADLAAFIATLGNGTSAQRDYKIIKLVGTTEAPLTIASKVGYFTIFYYENDNNPNSEKVNSYAGFHGFSLYATMGQEWVDTYTGLVVDSSKSYGTATKSGGFKTAYTGEMYVIFEYAGSTSFPYMYFGLLGAGANLTAIPTITPEA